MRIKILLCAGLIFTAISACSMGEGDFESNPLDPARGVDSQGPTILLTGIVRDEVSGGELSGAVVTAYVSSYSSYQEIQSVTSGADGFYSMRMEEPASAHSFKMVCKLINYVPGQFKTDVNSGEEMERYYNTDFSMQKADSLTSLNSTLQYFSIAKDGINWYRFTTPSSGNYYVYWNDRNNTSGYADVVVSAYHNGFDIPRFEDDDYSSSLAGSLSAGDTLYVKVETHYYYNNSGTFAIRVAN